MKVYGEKARMRSVIREWEENGSTVGLVPTMGALHPGHLSLVSASIHECDRTVVSIFLNPTQFGENEDLDSYPKRLDDDLAALREAGTDAAFVPNAAGMYPEGFCTWVVQNNLTEKLCGASRPDHFRGVCTIVAKLFAIIPAGRAYFGRKDFQQSVVIRRMVKDLDIPTEIRVMPVVREHDGLALSSRNEYLSSGQRRPAACLHDALTEARRLFRSGLRDVKELEKALSERLDSVPGTRTEYARIVDPDTLDGPPAASADSVAAVAVVVGDTRLIDNMPLGGELNDIYLPPRQPA